MYVLKTLTPILLIVITGYMLKHKKFLPAAFFRQTNKLVFYVALPCLLFYKTARPLPNLELAFQGFIVLLSGMFFCIITAYFVVWIKHIPKAALGAFVQGAYRSNLAYVGLPVVLFALAGANGTISQETESLAFLVLVPLIPIYNIAAVIILLSGSENGVKTLKSSLLSILKGTFKNPLIIAMACGILYSQTGFTLPVIAERTCSAIGQIALPLALLGIGASLTFKGIFYDISTSFLAALIKTLVGPLFGFFMGKMLGITSQEMLIVLLYLACPTAVASYIMAEQMNADHKLASKIVIFSVFLSLAGFSLILSLF